MYWGRTVLMLRVAGLIEASEYFLPPDSLGGWRMLKHAAQLRAIAGMDSREFDQASDFMQLCTPFHEGGMGGDDGIRHVLEIVSAAVRK